MNYNGVVPKSLLEAKRWNYYNGRHWDFIEIRYWPIDIAESVMKGTLNYVTIFRWFIYLIGNGMDPRRAKQVVTEEVQRSPKKVEQVHNLFKDLERNRQKWSYWDERAEARMTLDDTLLSRKIDDHSVKYDRIRSHDAVDYPKLETRLKSPVDDMEWYEKKQVNDRNFHKEGWDRMRAVRQAERSRSENRQQELNRFYWKNQNDNIIEAGRGFRKPLFQAAQRRERLEMLPDFSDDEADRKVEEQRKKMADLKNTAMGRFYSRKFRARVLSNLAMNNDDEQRDTRFDANPFL